MSAEHDNHGSTPAAWAAVTIIMVAFLVGAIGVGFALPWLFWVGVALVVLGIVVGKVMQMMGMGASKEPDAAQSPSDPRTTSPQSHE
jgi:hypothetical protein